MTTQPFSYDANLATAATPPARVYTDPGFLALEQERVFRGSWQFVAREDQLGTVGDYVTAEVAGQPIVLVRSE
jgi:phenylpropionate dioxygenase-like ring-hydroxylating dioxygenase large terminal subunit